MPSRGLPYASLPILSLLLAASASAGVTLPIGTPPIPCGIYEGTGNFGGNPLLTNCTGSAAATQLAAPSAPGITGIKFYTTSDIAWTLGGQLNGGVDDYPPLSTPQSTLETLVIETSGPILGDHPGDQFIGTMPINYSFSITPGTINCISTNPCNFSDVSVQWSLLFLIQGPGVGNSDGERGLASGVGTGSFLGSLSVPAPGSCIPNPPGPPICATAPPMTITQNAGVNTVSVSLGLFVTLPEDASAKFSISVPQTGSFDFQSAESIPEPATMGLLAAGLLLFGYRRLTSRS